MNDVINVLRCGLMATLVWLSGCDAPVDTTSCADDVICIDHVHRDGVVWFIARNIDRHMTITAIVDADWSNMQLEGQTGKPFVLRPGERRSVFSLVPDGSGESGYNFKYTWRRGDVRARHHARSLYSLPFAAGERIKVGQSCYGSFTHSGRSRYAVDFHMPEGTPIHSARAGTVVQTKQDSRHGGRDKRYINDANYVAIEHDDGTYGIYKHLRLNGVAVEPGDQVDVGELIGFSGNTGFSTTPHLHFEVSKAVVDDRKRVTVPVVFETASGAVSCPARGDLLAHP